MKVKKKLGIIDVFNDNYRDSAPANSVSLNVQNLAAALCLCDFDVTVFSYTPGPRLKSHVVYQNMSQLAEIDFDLDVIISVDSVTPFATWPFWHQTQLDRTGALDQRFHEQLQRSHQLRMVWSQSPQIWGDDVLEQMATSGLIDVIVTLNDAHTTRMNRAVKGHRRLPEVLKSMIFQVRNGVETANFSSDISKKDPDLYIYSSELSESAQRCLKQIWPRVQSQLPQAKLQEVSPDQPDRSDLLSRARFSLWPGTGDGLYSVLDMIAAHVIPIGTRSDSVVDSGTEFPGFYLDSAIENSHDQDRFVELVVKAAQDSYLLQQHHYAAEQVRELASWHAVASIWQREIYHRMSWPLDPQQQTQTDWLVYRQHRVFNQRQYNQSEITTCQPPTTEITSFDYPPLRIAIVDLVGTSYSGHTLEERGLGGSESAVIQIGRELAQLGMSVTVFNACDEDGHQPGHYSGVEYCAISSIPQYEQDFDVVISSRTAAPFARNNHMNFNLVRSWPSEHFERLQKCPHRIVWMHDTFSWGDQYLELMVKDQSVTEIWALSDFHFDYLTTCDHGSMRHYEFLKNHVWITRNGIGVYDIAPQTRDPDLFLFNANQSKGLYTLLNLVWPQVEQQIPQARLVIIGGYYNFGSQFDNTDGQEFELMTRPHRSNSRIHFTGVITQKVVAEWSAKASYFIYPATLPETFGISAWEALYQGTPLITCRFGALEETATKASWFLDYPIQPNSLYPDIDYRAQTDKFVDLVVAAYQEGITSRGAQAQAIRDIATWRTVALEWKQHVSQLVDRRITPSETQTISYSIQKYQTLTGRRYRNLETVHAPKHTVEQPIAVISPFRNAAEYLERCILSVAAQNYSNYHHYLIDDASTDHSVQVVADVISALPKEFDGRFTLIENDVSQGAVYNQVSVIRDLDPDTIVVLLDGDDWLANRPDIFDHYNWLYHQGTEFSYGSVWSLADHMPLMAQPYPQEVLANRGYRSHRFTWGLPYTHLRTFRQRLMAHVPDSAFQDRDGQWYRAGGDGAMFYNVIEQANPDHVRAVSDIMYCYNDLNPLNDYKVNAEQQNRTAAAIAQSTRVIPSAKKILIAIPTAKYIEPETFKSIYDQIRPEGYDIDFQYFYGYRIDQVRNLIAHWACQGYDYLWAVDSDISFPPDTLMRLLAADRDMVSALYRQRLPEQHLEIYLDNGHGGVRNARYDELRGRGLVEIAGCGFGCVLIKSSVLRQVGAPQFEYHVALDHNNTVSEDLDFCQKARGKQFKIWAETSVLCDHHGSTTYRIQ